MVIFLDVANTSIRLVVPYFGQRPTYFPLVVASMARNPDVSWLMLTDAPVPDRPPNLTVQRWELADLAERIQQHFDFRISLAQPYKLCDFRPAFGEVFAAELEGYDFWGHCDLDVIFGQIRDHLPEAAFAADKILVRGSFSLYRNTEEAAGWFRRVTDRVDHRSALSTPATAHFDEWLGIYRILRTLDVPIWQEENIFDMSLRMYRTRAGHPTGRDPRRYAWEDGTMAEYRIERGRVQRRTAMLIHLQKRRMRRPSPAVLGSDRYWVNPDGFAVQHGVGVRDVLAARLPTGRDLLPFHLRRVQRRRAGATAVGVGPAAITAGAR